MSDAIKEIKRFAEERGIDKLDYEFLNEATNIIEEVFEGAFVKIPKDRREEFKNRVWAFIENTVNDMNLEPEDYTPEEQVYERLDWQNDIITFCLTGIMKQGFDPEKTLLETAKEINSRQQDPKQKEEWAKNGRKGKWLKNLSQDPKTLYKADYSKCKG